MSVGILGLAVYPLNQVWKNVELLVRSAKQNSPSSEIALITAQLGEKDAKKLHKFGVSTFQLADLPPAFDHASRSGKDAHLKWIKALWVRRHDYYLEVLRQIEQSRVLLTDTRDVIITGDLSTIDNAGYLVFSQEDNERSIASEPNNRQWLMDGYGSQILNDMGNQRILCAGTVFGERPLIIAYVSAMRAEIERLGYEVARNIGDQPIHNFLAYMNFLPQSIVSTAEEGWIKAIGIMSSEKILNDLMGDLTLAYGNLKTKVLHQYDRHLKLRLVTKVVRKAAALRWWQGIS